MEVNTQILQSTIIYYDKTEFQKKCTELDSKLHHSKQNSKTTLMGGREVSYTVEKQSQDWWSSILANWHEALLNFKTLSDYFPGLSDFFVNEKRLADKYHFLANGSVTKREYVILFVESQEDPNFIDQENPNKPKKRTRSETLISNNDLSTEEVKTLSRKNHSETTNKTNQIGTQITQDITITIIDTPTPKLTPSPIEDSKLSQKKPSDTVIIEHQKDADPSTKSFKKRNIKNLFVQQSKSVLARIDAIFLPTIVISRKNDDWIINQVFNLKEIEVRLNNFFYERRSLFMGCDLGSILYWETDSDGVFIGECFVKSKNTQDVKEKFNNTLKDLSQIHTFDFEITDLESKPNKVSIKIKINQKQAQEIVTQQELCSKEDFDELLDQYLFGLDKFGPKTGDIDSIITSRDKKSLTDTPRMDYEAFYGGIPPSSLVPRITAWGLSADTNNYNPLDLAKYYLNEINNPMDSILNKTHKALYRLNLLDAIVKKDPEAVKMGKELLKGWRDSAESFISKQEFELAISNYENKEQKFLDEKIIDLNYLNKTGFPRLAIIYYYKNRFNLFEDTKKIQQHLDILLIKTLNQAKNLEYLSLKQVMDKDKNTAVVTKDFTNPVIFLDSLYKPCQPVQLPAFYERYRNVIFYKQLQETKFENLYSDGPNFHLERLMKDSIIFYGNQILGENSPIKFDLDAINRFPHNLIPKEEYTIRDNYGDYGIKFVIDPKADVTDEYIQLCLKLIKNSKLGPLIGTGEDGKLRIKLDANNFDNVKVIAHEFADYCQRKKEYVQKQD